MHEIKAPSSQWVIRIKSINFMFTRGGALLSFFKNGQIPASFVYCRPYLITISIIEIEKSLDGVHGMRTDCRRMVGTDKTTELWQPPSLYIVSPTIKHASRVFKERKQGKTEGK